MYNFEDLGKSNSNGIISRLSSKQKKIIAAVVGILVIFVAALCIKNCGGSGGDKKTISLVNFYYENGEYDRALDTLQALFLKNPDNKEVQALMKKIIAAKGNEDGSGSSGSSVNVTVDTDGLTDAMRSTMEAMKSELAKSNAQNEKQQRQMAEQNRQMAELMKKQQENAALEKERLAEQKAMQKAAEEQRKKEEAARKAQEEELARKNAKLKAAISAVNDEIQQGKSDLNAGAIDSALAHFSKAYSKLPLDDAGDSEPGFSVSKNSEMAGALYDASLKASNPEDKKKLLAAAVDYAKKATALDPKDANSQYILGMDAFEKKNYQAALEHLSKATANDKTKNYLYYYNLGRVQYMMKKYTEAKYSFTTACQLNGNFAPARYNLGLTNNKLNDSKAALAEFRRAHDIDPRHEKAYLEEARCLSRQNDYAGAISAYQNVLRINNTNRNALNELGSVYYQAKKYSEAESTFKQSLAMLPAGTDDSLTYYNLSTVLFEEKKYQDAFEYAKKAYDSCGMITDKNSRANVIYNYALLCEKNGNTDDAISKYAEVLQYNPKHLKTQINLGVMYMGMTPPDTDTALSLFLKAYSVDNKNFEVNNNLGSCYLAKEQYENAIKYFQNALKIDTKNNDVRYNLGQAFASSGQFDNAKTTYTQVLQQDANNVDAYIELGKVCMALSDNASAEKYFSVAQIKNPNHRKAEVDALLSQLK